MAFNRDITHSRYEMPKAGLQLLTRHAPQFNQYIIDDYEVGHSTHVEILRWRISHFMGELKDLGRGVVGLDCPTKQKLSILKKYCQNIFGGEGEFPDQQEKQHTS